MKVRETKFLFVQKVRKQNYFKFNGGKTKVVWELEFLRQETARDQKSKDKKWVKSMPGNINIYLKH